MIRRMKINRTEREILTTLYWALRPLTTSQIAEKNGFFTEHHYPVFRKIICKEIRKKKKIWKSCILVSY